MAAITRKILVCDICGSDGPTARYVIAFPQDGRRTFDLCPTDAAPLDVLYESVKDKNRKGPRMKGQPVVPEAVIRQARKGGPAKKKASRKPAARSRKATG